MGAAKNNVTADNWGKSIVQEFSKFIQAPLCGNKRVFAPKYLANEAIL
jgi:hypothetical protein